MNLHAKRHLGIGDEVQWLDPDADIGTGFYRIIEIVTESGRVERDDSVVVLADSDGHCTEAYVCELS